MTFVERFRAFEQRCQSEMKGFLCPVHLCLGQEEVPAALHRHIRPADWLFSTHRSHGHYLSKGGSEERLWDEIRGLDSGVNDGFSGSQCFSDPSINFHASAIVGGLVGVAVGTAYALKGTGHIAVCCIGDAVAEQGVLWEAMNFAALHKLPISFVCENNGYSIHTHISERQHGSISKKAQAFGMTVSHSVEIGLCDARINRPSFVEVFCIRECAHVGVMEDLRVTKKSLELVESDAA